MASIDFVNMDFIVMPRPGDGGGYSWSLTTAMGELLDKAENLYGPRDKAWTPLGIEFSERGPKTWFPGNRRQVSILLSLNARTNAHAAIFELAHEVIHLLAPTGSNQGCLPRSNTPWPRSWR